MVDVRLLYPTEKLEAAARLAEAIEAAGYTVERRSLRDTGAFPDLSANSAEAKVLLLVWARGLVTAAMNGGLAEARRSTKLVEVSVDGIEPGVAGEVSPVILLSGWRGQPFHLGWQRILAEIGRLAGRREAPKKSVDRVPAAVAGPDSAGAPRPSAPRRTGVRVAVAAGALLVATLGAATVLDWGGPNAGADSRAASVPGDAPAATAGRAPLAEASAPPAQPAGGTSAPGTVAAAAPVQSSNPVGVAAGSPASGALAAPSPSEGSAPERRAEAAPAGPRKKGPAQRIGAKRLALAPAAEVKRYSRKYSKTMRLFCQRSGRSTPQCRTFARSMRDQRG